MNDEGGGRERREKEETNGEEDEAQRYIYTRVNTITLKT